MDIPADKCLVIEDGLPGIQAAKAAAIDCLVVDRDQFVQLNPGA